MTILGAPLVIKTFDAHCNGECGGVIFLTTDLIHAAYAITSDIDSRGSRAYEEADATVSLAEDGTITVNCAAFEPNHLDTCTGSVSFDKDRLNAEVWVATAEHAAYMTAMERE